MIVNIEKRHVFLIVGVLVFFGGLFFVNAFGGDSPVVMGHSSGEIVVDDAFCNRITGHGCGVDNNVVTECLDDEFLDGDGSCLTAEEIVGVAGGGVILSNCYWTTRYSPANTVSVTYSRNECQAGEIMVGIEEEHSASNYYHHKVVSIKCCDI